MTRSIEEVVKIAMEITVFGVVVLLVSLSLSISNTMNNKRIVQENLVSELEKQSMLYSYDSGYVYDFTGAAVVNPRVYMTGDDIILLANKYAREIDIRVQLNCENSCSCLNTLKVSETGECVCSMVDGGCVPCGDNPGFCSCITLNPNSPEDKWSVVNIMDSLGNNIKNTFIPVLNKDNRGVVDCVIFYSKNKQML